MSASLRAGVIGAGVFGGHHAAKWSDMAGVRLAAVLDTHLDRATALAARHGARGFDDRDAFLAEVDIVSVCSPASHHAACALASLKAGRACYIEKPVATRLDEADALIAAARAAGVVAACGFLERATFAAAGLTDRPERPVALDFTRLGAPSPRNQDVSVVLDLMVHDLDLALALTGSEPLTVEAEGRRNAKGLLDRCEAEVTFESGAVARFRSSRLEREALREAELHYAGGTVALDLVARTLSDGAGLGLDPDFAKSAWGSDPLGASLAGFLAAVRGEGSPLAGLVEGARALDLALAVESAVGG